MGQRAIRNWIRRHSYHSAEQAVKNKKLDHRVSTYPFFQAYRTATVKNFPFYNQALLLLDTTWLEK